MPATLPIRCRSCGASTPLRMTTTPSRDDDGAWVVQVHIDDTDIAMLRLFTAAHRGDFGR